MKKSMRRKCVLLFLLWLWFFTTGCSGGKDGKGALAIVAGVHSNSYTIPLNSSSIRSQIYDACYSHGEISIINVDGDPKVIYQTVIPESRVSGLSENKQKTIAEDYTAQIQEVLKGVTAVRKEVDTLAAIRLGAQSLRGAGADVVRKTLLILDVGINTTGSMDFSSGILNVENTEEVVKALRDLHEIPDLSGVDVVWAFCGEAAPPQKPLSERDKKTLREIWREVLLAAGARSVDFTADFPSNTPYQGLPDVKEIEVNLSKIEVKTRESREEVIEAEVPMETVVLDETRVQFVGDKAVFKDEPAARKAIEAVAKNMRAHPENRIMIVGTTASGDEAFCRKLSMDRASAVRDVLIDLGIPGSRMEVYGLGYWDPWHKTDIDPSGHWIEKNAAQNRRVLVIDTASDEAATLAGYISN